MTLENIIKLITQNLPFDAEHYPPLKNKSEHAAGRFAIKHLHLHLSKMVGKIAGVIEPQDHGHELSAEDTAAIRKAIRNLIQDTLRLASLLGITADDIEQDIQAWADSKKPVERTLEQIVADIPPEIHDTEPGTINYPKEFPDLPRDHDPMAAGEEILKALTPPPDLPNKGSAT